MSKLIKIIVIALFLAALLPTGPASSAKPSPAPTRTPRVKGTATPTATVKPSATPVPTATPPPPSLTLPVNWVQPTIPPNCSLGTDVNGSQTLVCWPDTGFQLFATAIIYAHGYVNPYFPAKTIPWDQLTFTDTSTIPPTQVFLPTLVTDMGYYFATTSYRAHGLVVQDAIQDLLLVRSKVQSRMNALFKYFVLGGVSEGGVITALSIERYPSSYYAGLAMCGPYGDFQKQVNYWGDFRTLYDAYNIKELPPDAVTIPEQLILDWYGNLGDSTLKTNTGDAVMATDVYEKSKALLDSLATMYDPLHPPYDPDKNTTVKDTFLGLLDYNIFATNNGKVVLGGNPFGNLGTNYPPNYWVPDINTLVRRYIATTSIPATYETTGVITKPLVLMHNLRDPIVPYWHLPAYTDKIESAGKLANLYIQSKVVSEYGHCNFTQAELMAALQILGSTALGTSAPSQEHLLSGKALEDYQRIMNAFSESGKFVK